MGSVLHLPVLTADLHWLSRWYQPLHAWNQSTELLNINCSCRNSWDPNMLYPSTYLYMYIFYRCSFDLFIQAPGLTRNVWLVDGNIQRIMRLCSMDCILLYTMFLCSWFLSCPLAYLCLDTVHTGCDGEVLFLKPKNIGRFTSVLCYHLCAAAEQSRSAV